MIPDKERITVRLILSASIMKTAGPVYVNLVLKPQLVYRFFDVTISTSVPVVKIHTTVTPMLFVLILLVASHVHVTLVLMVMVLLPVMTLMNAKTIPIYAIRMQLALTVVVAIVVNVTLVGLVLAQFVIISTNALPKHTIVMPMQHVLTMMVDSAVSARLDSMMSMAMEEIVKIGMNVRTKEVAITVTNGPFVRI